MEAGGREEAKETSSAVSAVPEQGQEGLRVGKSFNPREVSQREATGFGCWTSYGCE